MKRSIYTGNSLKTPVGIFSVFAILAIVGNVLFWWGILSVVASGLKTTNGQCGSDWAVSNVLYTEMFCPSSEEVKTNG